MQFSREIEKSQQNICTQWRAKDLKNLNKKRGQQKQMALIIIKVINALKRDEKIVKDYSLKIETFKFFVIF